MLGIDNWIQNFIHFNIRDLTPEKLGDIPNPHLEYAIYWTFKSVQAASFIGLLNSMNSNY
jgi:cytochrome oxidase assembly protein ShyY1